jgi:signal transduction histidine kinase
MGNMNRLFLRFVVLVVLSVSVATVLIYLSVSALFGDPLDDIARQQASAQIFLLEQYVDQAPADEWLARLNKVREVSKVRLDLVALDRAQAALAPPQRAALARGEVVIDARNKTFYRRVDNSGNRYIGSDSDVIVARGLPIDVGLAVRIEALRFAIVALALLIPIGLWSRAHWKGLQHLSEVAGQVGDGQLDARARLPPSASIYPLAERMNDMAGRIARLFDSQKNLLHSVSHELRTPIARLEFALELLRAKAADPALEGRIAAMEGDVAELNALVGELLGMARLDSAREANSTPFDLAGAVRACVAELQRPVELELAGLAGYRGDQRLLMRALGNLLRNAEKYADGWIGVTARCLPGSIEISVEDDGPGIPEAERERIFEPFYRLDRSRDRASGGFGLGLSIAQKAVALHGGSIRIGSSARGGATMTMVLPV